MTRPPVRRGSEVLSAAWLGRLGVPAHQLAGVNGEVRDRLDSLPAPLRAVVGAVDAGLGVLPAASVSTLCRLPGFSEYARLVDSLTAVSYFDLLGREAAVRLPLQREAPSARTEPV